MTIEFIGIAATAPHSETEIATSQSDPVQPGYLEELARAHEDAGFDRVLVAHSSASPDGFTVADQVLSRTQRLGVLLAHRPGFVAPTYAARKFATLDAFHPGRVALHVITGGDDADQARDGDLTDKVTRYRRTDEFLDVLRLEWTSATPFDYAGSSTMSRAACRGCGPRRTDRCLLRGRVSGRDPGRRQARGRVRVLGRAAAPASRSGSTRCGPRPARTGATPGSA